MTETAYDDLVAHLEARFGDGLLLLVRYTGDTAEFLVGEEEFANYVVTSDTRRPEKIHEDIAQDLQHAAVRGDLYGNDIRAALKVTEEGTGLNLFLGYEGLYLWFAPDVTLEVPDDVEACLERARETSVLDAGGDDPE